jgi:hypothetical protein
MSLSLSFPVRSSPYTLSLYWDLAARLCARLSTSRTVYGGIRRRYGGNSEPTCREAGHLCEPCAAGQRGSKTTVETVKQLYLQEGLHGTVLTLLAGIIISPPLVVAFICWIEWYIRNDGSTNETINQVGQWSPLVSVAVVLFAALVYQLKGKLASADEIRDEIWRTEMHLRKLKGQLEKKNIS